MLQSLGVAISVAPWFTELLSFASAQTAQSLLDVIQPALQRLEGRGRVADGLAVRSHHDLRYLVFMNAVLVVVNYLQYKLT